MHIQRSRLPASKWSLPSLLLCAFATGCGPPEPPKQLTSNFSMAAHSLRFANFADGYDGSVLDAALMERMFGSGVCQAGSSPCKLTLPARSFMVKVNEAMGGGRCEGFAVLSSMFEAGKLDPLDFGGDTARTLELKDNLPLQQELAYWFATQWVPEAAPSKSYMAKDIMPALVDALSKGAKDRVRIGMVRKSGKTVSGGHAVTPIAYYSDPTEKGVYWLQVYDSNNPDTERLLKIDTANNRWEYEAAENPERGSRLYAGDETNNNPLFLAPVLSREGTLPCDFCESGDATVWASGGAQVSIETPSGVVGIIEGEFSNLKDSIVFPSLSAPLDNEPLSTVIRLGANDQSESLTMNLRAPQDFDFPNALQDITVQKEEFTVSASGLTITGNDGLTVENNGSSVSYQNDSRTDVTISSQVTTPNGGTLEVTAVVQGGSSEVKATIDSSTGQVGVEASDSNGAQVTMVVTATNSEGTENTSQLTFTSEGGVGITADTSSFQEGGALTGTVVSNGETTPVTNACEDGIKSGAESDVDCGAVCPTKCLTAQSCGTGGDCATGLCHAVNKVCVENACADGAKNGQETGVDCGGNCAPCAAGIACSSHGDCTTGACVGNVCVNTFIIGLTVSGLPPAAVVVLHNNGTDELTASGNGSYAFPTRVTGAYAVTVKDQPATATCVVANGTGTATADVSDVQVTCTPTWGISGSLSGLPASTSVTLQNDTESLTLSQNGSFTFSTRTSGPYNVTVTTQPAGATCLVANGSGTATVDVLNVQVTCTTTWSISGTLSGLPASTSVSIENGGETLALTQDGPFSFTTRTSGPYHVVVTTQPATGFCSVTNESGTASADVTNVQVSCVPTFSIGGILVGLPPSASVTLQNDAETLTLSQDGPFAFTTRTLGPYNVVVMTQPASGTCNVANGSGTATAEVTNLTVTCTDEVLYSGAFVSQVTATTQCTDFNTWKTQLTGSFSAMTMRGTYEPAGVTCADPMAASQLAAAINSGTALQVDCNTLLSGGGMAMRNWNFCPTNSIYGYDQIWLDSPSSDPCDPNNCYDTPSYALSPCSGFIAWGGVNTRTCNNAGQGLYVPSQTIEFVFTR